MMNNIVISIGNITIIIFVNEMLLLVIGSLTMVELEMGVVSRDSVHC